MFQGDWIGIQLGFVDFGLVVWYSGIAVDIFAVDLAELTSIPDVHYCKLVEGELWEDWVILQLFLTVLVFMIP